MSTMRIDDAGELIDRASTIDPESGEFAELIRVLHQRTDRAAFEAALAAARSPEIEHRLVGLHVLGQIGYTADRPYLEETLAALLTESASAADHDLVAAAVAALGHLHDPRALPGVLPHAGHPDADVRFCVAAALPAGTDSDTPDEQVVDALIQLTDDPDGAVRDWATFGLGNQLAADSPAIREALAARLDDTAGDTAGEALLGLATRHDPRALPRVLARLEDDPGNLIIEAAEHLADAACLPALLRLREQGWATDPVDTAKLDAAIAACTPAATGQL